MIDCENIYAVARNVLANRLRDILIKKLAVCDDSAVFTKIAKIPELSGDSSKTAILKKLESMDFGKNTLEDALKTVNIEELLPYWKNMATSGGRRRGRRYTRRAMRGGVILATLRILLQTTGVAVVSGILAIPTGVAVLIASETTMVTNEDLPIAIVVSFIGLNVAGHLAINRLVQGNPAEEN